MPTSPTKKKCLSCEGRATTREYWMTYLIVGAIEALLVFLAIRSWYSEGINIPWIILMVYNLIVLPPSIALSTRRLHDTNRSGLWMFLSMIPLIGSFELLIFMIMDSYPGTNRFGPNPKEIEREKEIQAGGSDPEWK